MPQVIDLNAYRTPGVRVFAGRDRGKEVRAAAGLNELDRSDELVEIRVPEDIFSVNSSFFLGMFGDSIRALGDSEFRRRFRFVGGKLDELIEDGIREALHSKSPL
jgi:hypothetical protein